MQRNLNNRNPGALHEPHIRYAPQGKEDQQKRHQDHPGMEAFRIFRGCIRKVSWLRH